MMMSVVLFLGALVDVVAIMMIRLPIFMPVVERLRFNPVWFCVLSFLNTEMASTTPPFGVALFTVKAADPPGTTKSDINLATFAFLGVVQYVEGLLYLLEPRFRPLVVGIHVRMVLARQFSIRLADFILRGVATQPESLIVVFRHLA